MIPATLTLADLKATIPPPPRSLTLDEIDTTIREHGVERARRS